MQVYFITDGITEWILEITVGVKIIVLDIRLTSRSEFFGFAALLRKDLIGSVNLFLLLLLNGLLRSSDGSHKSRRLFRVRVHGLR